MRLSLVNVAILTVAAIWLYRALPDSWLASVPGPDPFNSNLKFGG